MADPMETGEELYHFVGRLATFQESHRPAKRRASSTSRKKNNAAQQWPLAFPRPEELAYAGFYYKPSATSPDNVRCFSCKYQLDGWEEADTPAYEHLTHSPDCAWAINCCIALRAGDPDQVNDDPLGEKMLESRIATFGDRWPHEHKKGWKCKIKKMAEAGWIYDPGPDAEDAVQCPYCKRSLDGWEPKDSPLDEHRDRSPDCLFFTLCDEYAQVRKVSKARKGSKARGSKASRASTQSALSVSEAPSLMSLGDDGLTANDDSMLSTATAGTSATTASKGGIGRKGAAKATTKKGAGSKQNANASELTVGDETMFTSTRMDVDSDVPQPLPTRRTRRNTGMTDVSQMDASIMSVDPPPIRKASRTTRKAAIVNASQIESSQMTVEPDPPAPAKKPTRGRKGAANASQIESSMISVDQPAPKPTRGRGKAKAQEPLEEPTHFGSSEIMDYASTIEVQPKKPTRGTKRSSDGSPKVDSSAAVLDEAPAKPAPKARTKKGKKVKEEEESQIPRTSDIAAHADTTNMDQTLEPPSKPAPAQKKARKTKKQKAEEEAAAARQAEEEAATASRAEEEEAAAREAEEEAARQAEQEEALAREVEEEEAARQAEQEAALAREAEEEEAAARRAEEEEAAAALAQAKEEEEAAEAEEEEKEEEEQDENHDPNVENSPAPPSSAHIYSDPASQPSSPPAPKQATPSPSQSSDAENKPPSAHPSARAPPKSATKGVRIPLQEARLTPTTSPSKNQVSQVQSNQPWSAIDLETVFLPTPSTKRVHNALFDNNADAPGTKLAGDDFADASLREMMKKVKEGLTKEERNMSVEEWIRFNAKRGEDKLKLECERMVEVFESQGMKAREALEGIKCER